MAGHSRQQQDYPSYSNYEGRNPLLYDMRSKVAPERYPSEFSGVELPSPTAHSSSPKHEKMFLAVDDIPPWYTTILFGIQQILTCASGVIAMPLVVADLICAPDSARVKLVGTLLFITGISTFLQSTFGTRLPLLQGPSFAFIAPIVAMMNLPQFKCTAPAARIKVNASSPWQITTVHYSLNDTSNAGVTANLSSVTEAPIADDEAWMYKMQIIQGGLIAAAVVEMLIGMTGIIGLITKFVGPLTIAPLMLLLEFSVINICLNYCLEHYASGAVVLLLLILALYLHSVRVPLPFFSLNKRKCSISKYPLFAIFPYLIGISAVWITCAVLTYTNVLQGDYHKAIRTDLRSHMVEEAPWFRWPYPGQWGMFRFNTGIILGMIAATVASVIESVGDYHACARACEVPPPPSHAVNRGILMEGFCCVIGGVLGGGVGVTTYSENVGVIGITKVASRRTLQAAGAIFVILGVFTKFGAVLATIPNPLVGGIMIVSLSMVGGVGLSSVQLVDLTLSRNSAILGFALMLGILVPGYFKASPVVTGNETADQLLNILLSIQMLVGGVIGFILDNTIPGATREQRGLVHGAEPAKELNESVEYSEDGRVYDFPPRVIKALYACGVTRFMPFMPNFGKSSAD